MNIRLRLEATAWLIPLFICVFFSIVFISMSLDMYSRGQEKLIALNHDERAIGVIVRDYESLPDTDGGTSHSLTYRFTLLSGEEIEGEFTDIDSGILPDRTVGNPIEIAYNPEKPSINVPANAGYEGVDYFILFLTMILTPSMSLAFSVFCGHKAWQTWKEPPPWNG
jgi:hypothetical protein